MDDQNKIILINIFEKLEHAILLEKNIIACEYRSKDDVVKPDDNAVVINMIKK
jgi:hypothetical protein